MSVQELQNKNLELEKQIKEIKDMLREKEQHLLLPTYEKFSFKRSEWDFWLKGYERYRKATKLNHLPQAQQINQLLLQMGNEVDKILYNVNRRQEDFSTYEEVKQFFNQLYARKTNVIYERAKFNQRYQREGETAEEYIAELVKLVKHCKYGQLSDELLRDRLVVGIRDRELSESLQMDEGLTMHKAMEKVQQAEEVREQNKILRQETTVNIERVQRKKKEYGNKGKSNFVETRKNKNKTPECNRCGRKEVHPFFKCPASKARCFKCQKLGHYGKCCRGQRQVREVKEMESDEESSCELEVGFIHVNNVDTLGENRLYKPWFVDLKIGEETINFKIDTGADETVISIPTYNKISKHYKLEKTKIKLVGPGRGNRHALEVRGVLEIPVECREIKTKIKAYVVNSRDNLLGRPALIKLNLIKFEDLALKVSDISSLELRDNRKSDQYKEIIIDKFRELFKDMGKLKNYKYMIKFSDDVKPYAVSTPRRVPFPLLEELRKELSRMLKNDIIYEVTEATEWCAPIVVTTRANGKIRVCTDYTELNKYVVRERLQLPTVEETLSKLSGATVFSKLDCSSGFWQLELSPTSRPYTTFITPFGRFAYKRLPFGITSAPEIFQRVLTKVVGHMEGVTVHVDDILVTGRNQMEHDKNLKKLLKALEDTGMKLNVNKCVFNLREVKHLGHIVGKEGIKADPANVKAVAEYPVPKSVQDVRRFLGMVNYLTKFIPGMSEKTKPLRDLLNKNSAFLWTADHDNCFQKIKVDLTNTPVLAPYNPKYPTRVSADSSSFGIGGVMEQKQPDRTWRVNIYVSASLSETERRYAQIEKEAVAILKTVERLQQYLVGLHFQIFTDHKPLVPLLKTKPINELTPRLQRIRMRLTRYSFDILYIPGKDLIMADSLSRAPLRCVDKDEDVLHQEIQIFSVLTRENVQANDKSMSSLRKYILDGWPEHIKQVDDGVKPYFKYRTDLSTYKEILLYKDRVVIPPGERRNCLTEIHRGHQGISRCKRRAKMSVWWPSINNDITNLVENCEECLKHQKEHYEPFLNLEDPHLPWCMIGADLCEHKNHTYLVVQDYYSKFVEVAELKTSTTGEIMAKFKEMFARFGIPKILRTDNASYFVSHQFRKFLDQWRVKHCTSSPHYAASNGLAESAVKLVKNILKKEEDLYLGLLAYRNTPTIYEATPAQLLMGRNLRDKLPVAENNLRPRIPNHEAIYRQMRKEKEKQAKYYDKHHNTKEMKQLQVDDRVWIKDMNQEGTIRGTTDHPRSYAVETKRGSIRRNRKFLVKLPPNTPQIPSLPFPENPEDTFDYNVTETLVRETGLPQTLVRGPSSPKPKQPLAESTEEGGHPIEQDIAAPVKPNSIQERRRRVRNIPKRFKDYIL